MAEPCRLCGNPSPLHVVGEVDNWDGGVWPVCEASRCYLCADRAPVARVDRVNVCARCKPGRVAAVANAARGRELAGVPLSGSDARALRT